MSRHGSFEYRKDAVHAANSSSSIASQKGPPTSTSGAPLEASACRHAAALPNAAWCWGIDRVDRACRAVDGEPEELWPPGPVHLAWGPAQQGPVRAYIYMGPLLCRPSHQTVAGSSTAPPPHCFCRQMLSSRVVWLHHGLNLCPRSANGPNHLELWFNGLSSNMMALITSNCDAFTGKLAG